MTSRRLPTGALAALAVVLAALAVVVVAGARVPVVRVLETPTTLASHGPPRPRPPADHADAPSGASAAPFAAPTTPPPTTPPAAITTTTSPVTAPPATTTIPTTTVAPATTTTVPVPVDRSLQGVLDAGSTSVVRRVGRATTVEASVQGAGAVTLSVSCGLRTGSATAHGQAVVRLASPGSACIATIQVAASTPRPAPWRLVVS